MSKTSAFTDLSGESYAEYEGTNPENLKATSMGIPLNVETKVKEDVAVNPLPDGFNPMSMEDAKKLKSSQDKNNGKK